MKILNTHPPHQHTCLSSVIQHELQAVGFIEEVAHSLSAYEPYVAKIDLNWRPDFTITTFAASRSLKKNAVRLADDVAQILKTLRYVRQAESTGPYINFSLHDDYISLLLGNLVSYPSRLMKTSDTRGMTILDTGKLTVGIDFPIKQIAAIEQAYILQKVLTKCNRKSKLILRIEDWNLTASVMVADEMNRNDNSVSIPSHIPEPVQLSARQMRRILDKLTDRQSVEYQAYETNRERWITKLQYKFPLLCLTYIQLVGDAELAEQATTLLYKLAVQNPDKFIKDDDSSAVFIHDEPATALITHDGMPTSVGYDLVHAIHIAHENSPSTIIYSPDRLTSQILEILNNTLQSITKDLQVITIENKSGVAEANSMRETLYNIEDVLNAFNHTIRPNINNSNTEFSDTERAVALKLLSYANTLEKTADDLNIHHLDIYIQSILQLIKNYVEQSLNTQEGSSTSILVCSALKAVIKDISEIIDLKIQTNTSV